MPAKVTFASARPKELRPDATLPPLFDKMLGKWDLKKRFEGKRVAIKMHLGGNIGYSTIHPVLTYTFLPCFYSFRNHRRKHPTSLSNVSNLRAPVFAS